MARNEGIIRTSAGLLVAGALVLLATSTTAVGTVSFPLSSPQWWAQNPENETPVVEGSGVYQPKTDEAFIKHVQKARKGLPVSLNKAWRNVGPFGGIENLPGVGPGAEKRMNAGGIGTTVAVHPSDPDTAYFGTFGGLYKTTDGGKTMRNVTEGSLLRSAIGAVGIDPKNPDHVYAGTGVAINTVSNDAVGAGVYVSHDAGKTWTRPVQNTNGYGVNAVVVSPNGFVFVGTNFGLWRSSDAGASFQKIALPNNADHTGSAPLPLGSTISSIVLRPDHPEEVTVAVGWARGKEVLSDGTVIGPGNGLYRSTSNGGSGTFRYLEATSQLTWPGASTDPFGRTSIAYANSDLMWALVQDAGRASGKTGVTDIPALPGEVPGAVRGAPNTALNTALGVTALNGVYRSEDNGATWTLAATTQTLTAALGGASSLLYPIYGVGVQATFNNYIAADPTNVNRVYLGLEEVYAGEWHSPVDGVPAPMTWRAIAKYADACGFLLYASLFPFSNGISCPEQTPFYGEWTTHPDQHAVAVVKTSNGVRYYSGNDGGWWVQDSHALSDGATGFDNNSWRSLNSPATVLPYDVTMLQDGSLVVALQDNGTVHIRKDGTAYSVCGGDGVKTFPGVNKDSFYCGYQGLNILATTDDFAHTTRIAPELAGATFMSPWYVDRKDGNHLIAAAGVIAESTAGIDSALWDPSSTVMIDSKWVTVFTPAARADKFAWDSSAAFTQGNVSYVGMCARCRPAFSLKTIADPSKVNSAIATNVKPGCTAAPAKSTCWHLAASKGLPHQQISGIAVDPKDPKTVYVSLRQYLVLTADPKVTGDQKVMVSRDAGESFTDITGNLPRVDAHNIALREGRLIVSTDVGIFTVPAGSTSWERLGAGLPETMYRAMKMELTGRYLIAGAYGRGAWVYDFGSPERAGAAAKPATKVKGGRLAATGAESRIALALVMLMVAVLMSRRLHRA